MRLSISYKIVLITSAVLILAITGNAVVNGVLFSREYARTQASRAIAIGQSLKSQLNRLLSLNIPLENLSGFEKQCFEVVESYDGISYAMVADLNGRVLFHSDPDMNGVQLAAPYLPRPGEEGHSPQVVRVGEFYEAVIPVFDAPGVYLGTVRIGFPEKIVADQRNRLLKVSGLSGAAFICLSILVLFFLLQHLITRPLSKLIFVIQAIRENRSDVNAADLSRRKDEIGNLGASFMKLMEELNRSRSKIEEYADHLEEVVKQRTRELQATNRDLNEEVQERKKAVQLYRELFEDAPVMYVITRDNPDGSLITNCNELFLQTLGFLRYEVIGRKLGEFYTRDSVGETREVEEETELPGSYKSEEYRLKTKDGRTIETLLRAIPQHDDTGYVTGARVMFVDITARKAAEKENNQLLARLRRAEKMEALGVLAGGVAHDLNNILSAIVTYPELLMMQLPSGSPLEEPLRTIHHSGLRAATVVQDLLTLSRRGVTITEVVDLNTVISDFLNSPECAKIRSFHPTVTIRASLSGELLAVKGSPVHLSKVIMNLVANAAEAMPEGGPIRITTRNTYYDRVSMADDQIAEGDYVVIEVADEGLGIAREDQDKIFEPFYTKKVMGRSGSGLGMAVVWGTVKDHEGFIDLDSSPGKGSVFSIILPATRKKVPVAEARRSMRDYMGGGETVLVVDDVAEQRRIASGILSELGYRVATCDSGADAIRHLQSEAAELVVLDMIMPNGMDGLETFLEIRKLNPRQKVIIASGFSETERVRKMQELGAGEYIRKPYTIARLAQAVHQAVLAGF